MDFANAKKKVSQHVKRELVEALKAATPVDTGEARDGWYIEGDSIKNDVPHIVPLNEGSSQQAPAYFVEGTLLAHKGVVPNGAIVRSK